MRKALVFFCFSDRGSEKRTPYRAGEGAGQGTQSQQQCRERRYRGNPQATRVSHSLVLPEAFMSSGLHHSRKNAIDQAERLYPDREEPFHSLTSGFLLSTTHQGD